MLTKAEAMGLKRQIDEAIAVHGMWKARLRRSINTGESNFDPVLVESDCCCDFGKWLYESIAPELKQTLIYAVIIQHHIDFHVEAARVLRLALSGDKEDAKREISSHSKFSLISAVLTSAMIEWKKGLPLS